MKLDGVQQTLTGTLVRLEPLGQQHAEALAEAAGEDPELYRWSPVPQGVDAFRSYVDTALSWRIAGHAVPYATVRLTDERVIGSTRFWNIERWPWPARHERAASGYVDGLEIGYSWLARSAIRTGANTEAKLLLLRHAFERWNVLRVCFHADARNERSLTALARLGARREGTLRSHRLAVDLAPRDSVRFSITAAEWPQVQRRLERLLAGHRSS